MNKMIKFLKVFGAMDLEVTTVKIMFDQNSLRTNEDLRFRVNRKPLA